MMSVIYTIADPVTFEIVYVGLSTDFSKRKYSHLTTKGLTSPIGNYLDRLRLKGLSPIIEIIDECKSENSYFFEGYWIEQCISWGFNLLNKQINRKNTFENKVKKLRPNSERSTISFVNRAFREMTQQRANVVSFGNISNYINRLILDDFKANGIDIDAILKI